MPWALSFSVRVWSERGVVAAFIISLRTALIFSAEAVVPVEVFTPETKKYSAGKRPHSV